MSRNMTPAKNLDVPIEKERQVVRFNLSTLAKKPAEGDMFNKTLSSIYVKHDLVPCEQLTHVERAFRRDENTIVGFGQGMIGPLLGNTARRGKSIRIQPPSSTKFGYDTIGYSCEYHTKNEPVIRQILPSMHFKRTFDYGDVNNIPQLGTTGYPAEQVDTLLGLPYGLLDGLSVRK